MNAGAVPGPQPVAVFGEALVDEFPDGSRVAGGAPFNVARWLAALGLPVCFVSRIGRDEAARAVLDSAARRGLPTTGVQRDSNRATGRVRVTLQADGPRFAIEADAAWDHIDAGAAAAAVHAAAPAVLVFGTLAQRHADSREALRAVLHATPARRLLDLNLRPGADGPDLAAEALAQADWVKVNDAELAQLLAWFTPAPAPGPGSAAHAVALAVLVRRFGLARLVVTCGDAGWYAVDAAGAIDHRGAAEPVPVLVDTVGAGDAFSAGLAAGLALNWPLAPTLVLAGRLAAAACGQRGAMPEDAAFFDPWRAACGLPLPAPEPRR